MNKNNSRILMLLLTSMILVLSLGFASAIQSAVDLGTAGNFVILSKTGISTTGTTSIVGNIGTSPIDSTAITGFGLIMDSSNQFSRSSLVNGSVYAADYTAPTPTVMTSAIGDMQTAYTDAAGRTLPDFTELGAGNIGGMTLTPGLYKWGTGVTIPTDVFISGNSSDVWIFQIAGTLDISSSKQVILLGTAKASNIFWQVADKTTLGTTSVFNGNILDLKEIIVSNGATLNGRALSQTAVTLDANSVSLPAGVSTTPVLTTITISSANITLGSGLQLNITRLDQFGLPMAVNITYASSNSSIATINASGFVNTFALGNVTINATNGTIIGFSIINVVPVPVVVPTPSSSNDDESSSGGSGGSRTSCSTEWTCSNWNACSNDLQTRTCSYPSNMCKPMLAKPVEFQVCNLIGVDESNTPETDNPTNSGPSITGGVIGAGDKFNGIAPIGQVAIFLILVAGIYSLIFFFFKPL